jgi:hypothetical protein
MTEKTVAQKARVKRDAKVAVLDPAPGVVDSLGLPEGVTFVPPEDADLVFLFVSTRPELETRMPEAVRLLRLGAALWVFFRKGSKTARRDMNRNDIWAIAERLRLRPLGLVGIDDTWSAFRLRHGEEAGS